MSLCPCVPMSLCPCLGRVTGEQLSSYARLFKGHVEAVETHAGVLQLALATAQTLCHPTLPRWDASLAFQRLLLQVGLTAYKGNQHRVGQMGSVALGPGKEKFDKGSFQMILSWTQKMLSVANAIPAEVCS